MNIHDSGYKRLFSNKTIFRQLIETFIEEPWVQEVDFANATRIDKSFVSEHYKETESDIIYRVSLRRPDGTETELYFYVLIEFQSSVQRFMAVRVLQYISSLYLDHLLTYGVKETERLPAVLPIVLYNGDERWTAPTSLTDLIADYPPLGDYRPSFDYLKIAENEFSLGQLLGIRNIISALFIVEAHYNLSFLINWFRQLAVHGRIENADFGKVEATYRSTEETRSMLITAIEKEKQAILQQGIEQGIEQGAVKERQEIARAMQAKGFAEEVIADVMGVTLDQIQALLQKGNATNTDRA